MSFEDLKKVVKDKKITSKNDNLDEVISDKDNSIISNNDSKNKGGKDDVSFGIAIEPNKPMKKEKYFKLHTIPFNFSSKLLRDCTKVIYEHTSSGYNQINLKTIQNIGFLMCYGGINTDSFYYLDLSPSGVGKGENIAKNSDLLLNQVFKIQEEKLKEDIDNYHNSKIEATGKEEKDKIPEPKMHKCIHSNDLSKEALYESFEAMPSQMIEFSELGLRLKQKDDKVITYIVDGHSKKSILAPNYKNARFKKSLRVENISLFFTGDTNLQYLGKDIFYNHLQGGLINRCMIVFNDYIPDYEHMPKSYVIDKNIIDEYTDISMNIVKFAMECKNHNIPTNYLNNSIFIEYESFLHNKKKELLENRNPFGHFYSRAVYNFRAILKIIHLIKCFEDDIWHQKVEDSTICETIELCRIYFDFSGIINELNGIKIEKTTDKNLSKLINYIDLNKSKLPLKIRDLQRGTSLTNINVTMIKSMLITKYNIDDRNSLILSKKIK